MASMSLTRENMACKVGTLVRREASGDVQALLSTPTGDPEPDAVTRPGSTPRGRIHAGAFRSIGFAGLPATPTRPPRGPIR
jgi:fructose-1,6-bisphosphatase/sedoheptulose 1,7-bisphosphatase-like protein